MQLFKSNYEKGYADGYKDGRGKIAADWTKVQKQKASKRPIRDQMELWRNHENRIKKLEKDLRERKNSTIVFTKNYE